MALPTTGPIKLSQVKDEFDGPDHKLSSYYRGRNNVTANNTGVPVSGTIGLGHLRGAAKVVPGSTALTTPGTHSFIVPAFATLTIELWGGGGGGQGVQQFGSGTIHNGVAGGASTASQISLSAGGGGVTGGGGSASGGDINTNGGNSSGRTGGAAPNSSGTPGYGGQGAYEEWEQYESPRSKSGAGGGGGAYVKKTFSAGQLPVGTSLSLIVGAGGAGGYNNGGAGKRGEIRIVWS